MLLASGGPMEFAKQMKEKGRARFIGITGHNHPPRFADILKTGEVQRELNRKGDILRAGMNQALKTRSVRGCVYGASPVFRIFLGADGADEGGNAVVEFGLGDRQHRCHADHVAVQAALAE